MNNTGISILISTYNGALRLEKTLTALANLDLSDIPFVELIIVDNASTDDILNFSKEIWQKLGAPFSLICLSEKLPGKLHAQEKGLKYVKGKYVVICDDDNSLFSDYLQIGFRYLNENPKIGVLGGRGIGVSTVMFPEWFEQYSYYYGCAPQASKTGNVKPTRNVVHGAGMWFRYENYFKAKELGYKFILGSREGNRLITGAEDSELCWMIIYQGYEVWYIDEMRFHHHITENRLTLDYRKKLVLGMTENGLNASIHYRVWNGLIKKQVKLFWLKEFCYILNYIIKIPFNQGIKEKWIDFKRAINNAKILLLDRSNYDEKIKQIIQFRSKCTTMN